MRPELLQALQERAEKFLRNCLDTKGRDPDVYVSSRDTISSDDLKLTPYRSTYTVLL